MKTSDDTLLRYLFGELPEGERAALEAEYFGDPQTFARLEQVENDLIDDYARGRLAAGTRARFERTYLSDPNRRARLKFAETLAVRAGSSVGQPAAQSALSPAIRSGNRWQ